MDVMLTCGLCGRRFPVAPALVKLFLGLDIIVCSRRCLEENADVLVSEHPISEETKH